MTEIPQKSRCFACGATFKNWGSLAGHVRYNPSCTDEKRFWGAVDKSAGPDGCWPYLGFLKWDGYGWVRRAGKNIAAHRYAWTLTHGPIKGGAHVLHACDRPACCNPAHLSLGTHDDNMAEMKKKGRVNSGNIKKYKPVLHPDRVRPRRAA